MWFRYRQELSNFSLLCRQRNVSSFLFRSAIFVTFSIAIIIKVFYRGHNFRTKDDASILNRLIGPLSPSDPKLIELVFDRFLNGPSDKPYNLQMNFTENYSINYNMYRTSLASWLFISEQLRLLFPPGQKRQGFFVEAGALDGEYSSNTLYLEVELGWQGLLIEPDTDMINALLLKNRRAWSCQCCLSTKPFPYKTVLSKITSQSEGTNFNFKAGNRVFNSLAESVDFEQRNQYGFPEYEVVQCLHLQTLLMALNVTHVDLISLDVEDVEVGILQNFSFDTIEVDVWVVEHRHPLVRFMKDDKLDEEFVKWFGDKGYILHRVSDLSPIDYIFIKKDSDIYNQIYKNY